MISNIDLDILIDSLSDYKSKGVDDPWLLSNGKIVEPLDVLIELRELRDSLVEKIQKGATRDVSKFADEYPYFCEQCHMMLHQKIDQCGCDRIAKIFS